MRAAAVVLVLLAMTGCGRDTNASTADTFKALRDDAVFDLDLPGEASDVVGNAAGTSAFSDHFRAIRTWRLESADEGVFVAALRQLREKGAEFGSVSCTNDFGATGSKTIAGDSAAVSVQLDHQPAPQLTLTVTMGGPSQGDNSPVTPLPQYELPTVVDRTCSEQVVDAAGLTR